MLYKALHNLSIGGIVFEADKLYSEEEVLKIGNPVEEIEKDFSPVEEAVAEAENIGVSKPIPDLSVVAQKPADEVKPADPVKPDEKTEAPANTDAAPSGDVNSENKNKNQNPENSGQEK